MNTKKCPRCGAEIPDALNFCIECGEKFSDVSKITHDTKDNKSSLRIISIIIVIFVIAIIILVINLNSKDNMTINNNTIENNQTVTTQSNIEQIVEDTSNLETTDISTNNEIIKSGQCGDNLTWSLDKNMTLTISGTGAMYDFEKSSVDIPWQQYAENINNIIIEYGITHIGNYAFYDCSNVDGIILPNSVISIGDCIMCNYSDIYKFVVISPSIVEISENAFENITGNGSFVIFSQSNTEIETIAILNGFGFVETQFNQDGSTELTLDDFRNLSLDKAIQEHWISTTTAKD